MIRISADRIQNIVELSADDCVIPVRLVLILTCGKLTASSWEGKQFEPRLRRKTEAVALKNIV